MAWTQDQRKAIEWTGGSLLVSAAAGSGKTSVLSERCAWLVCDAPLEQRCDIDELLVVTFTREAATEMRHRIESALQARLDQAVERQADDRELRRLQRQVLFVHKASIGTIHGFCATLVRQNFSVLGIDPMVRLLDDNEGNLLRREVGRKLVADALENDRKRCFADFLSKYAGDSDQRAVDLLLRVHELLSSVVDREQWKRRAIERLKELAEKPLNESALGKRYLELIGRELQALIDEGSVIARLADASIPKYGAYMDSWVTMLQGWKQLLQRRGLDAMIEETKRTKGPRLPNVPEETIGKKEMQKRIDKWKESIKERFASAHCVHSEEALRAKVCDTLEPTELLIDLSNRFDAAFSNAKRAERVMDFADLERFALKLLRDDKGQPTPIARQLQRQYRHVLVDEYQDINEVQDELLRLLSRESSGADNEPGNLFCVGDVKQSIYRFRLADPTRFLARYKRLDDRANPENSRIITLGKNFRSREALLESINSFFERVMSRETADIDYDASHRLNAGAEYPAPDERGFTGAPIEVLIVPKLSDNPGVPAADGAGAPANDQADANDDASDHAAEMEAIEREAAVIAARIREMVGDGTNGRKVCEYVEGRWTQRSLRHSDIAVLLRSTKIKSRQFAEQLRRAGIPVFAERRSGFFDALEVRDVVSLLEVLVNEQQDVPLAALLRSPLMKLAAPDDLLAQVRTKYPRGGGSSFAVAVHRYAIEQVGDAARALKSALETIARWRRLAFTRPVAELLDTIFEETGYLTYVCGLLDGEQRLANLLSLHDRARQFASFQRQSLQRFLGFLRELRDEADLGEPSLAGAGEAVRVMSIHQSKGLEFPVVFVADLDKSHNEEDLRQPVLMDRELGLALAAVDLARHEYQDTVAGRVVRARLRRDMLAEEMRVLYVAMTRAKEALLLVSEPRMLDMGLETQRWAGHNGAMPASSVLGATKFLQWIVPVSIMTQGRSLALTDLEANQVREAIERVRNAPRGDGSIDLFAKWEPLPDGLACKRADAILADVTRSYDCQNLTDLPAATSVSALTKHGRATDGARDRSLDRPLDFNKLLQLPRSVGGHEPTPAERGSATHLALQHLSFDAGLDQPKIEEQLRSMVERHLLTEQEASIVDTKAIAWFVTTPLGQLVSQHANQLRRELAVLVAEQTQPGADSLDRVMIRGRIDAMLALDDGIVLFDYKTDQVEGASLQERADFYMPQLRAYRNALEGIVQRPVRACHLVFLQARQVVDVD